MISKYYVAVRPRINENHSVHKEGCPFLNYDEKSIYLGEFSLEKDAIKEGERYFIKAKGCIFCSEEQSIREEKQLTYKWVEKDLIFGESEPLLFCHQSLVCCVN
ncbi:MAG: hypothetical protein WA816_11570 [Bacteroidales bacterium]